MYNDNKLYGASILNSDERNILEDSSIFDNMKDAYSDDEIFDMKEELKSLSDKKTVLDKTFTDAISGIRSSEKVRDKTTESISDIIDSKEKTGKEISPAGIDLLYNLLDTNPTEEELKSLSDYFKTIVYQDDIYAADINVLKNILGKRITNKLIDVAEKNGVREYEAITKFIIEVYKSYISIVQYNDDVNELYDLVMSISNSDGDVNFDFDDMDTLSKQLNALSDATERLKKLDDRNRRLKNDYKVTDFDILVIDSVKECLKRALSFEDIINKINNTESKKFKKDMKKIEDIKKSIGNWITDLRNDSETLFTFPVNDYLTAIESVDGLIDYIKGFIMLQDKHSIYTELMENEDEAVTDVEEYFLNNGYVTKSDLDNYEKSAISFLYFLSKTFKKKKIKTNDDRRVLSYTLDIISKPSTAEYAEKMMNIINLISERFLKIDSYKYIKTNN